MQAINATDFGAPKRVSEETISLEVNGVSVSVPKGSSVMYAASASLKLTAGAGFRLHARLRLRQE